MNKKAQALDEFTESYIRTALWSSTDDEEPLDENYDISDIADEALSKMIEDCARFQSENEELISQAWEVDGQDESMCGHDFWLTRNGHGAGFWDGDYPVTGDALTEASKAFGETNLYVGDDNKIYIFGSKKAQVIYHIDSYDVKQYEGERFVDDVELLEEISSGAEFVLAYSPKYRANVLVPIKDLVKRGNRKADTRLKNRIRNLLNEGYSNDDVYDILYREGVRDENLRLWINEQATDIGAEALEITRSIRPGKKAYTPRIPSEWANTEDNLFFVEVRLGTNPEIYERLSSRAMSRMEDNAQGFKHSATGDIDFIVDNLTIDEGYATVDFWVLGHDIYDEDVEQEVLEALAIWFYPDASARIFSREAAELFTGDADVTKITPYRFEGKSTMSKRVAMSMEEVLEDAYYDEADYPYDWESHEIAEDLVDQGLLTKTRSKVRTRDKYDLTEEGMRQVRQLFGMFLYPVSKDTWGAVVQWDNGELEGFAASSDESFGAENKILSAIEAKAEGFGLDYEILEDLSVIGKDEWSIIMKDWEISMSGEDIWASVNLGIKAQVEEEYPLGSKVKPMRKLKRKRSVWNRPFGYGKSYEVIGHDSLDGESLLKLKTGRYPDEYMLVYPDEVVKMGSKKKMGQDIGPIAELVDRAEEYTVVSFMGTHYDVPSELRQKVMDSLRIMDTDKVFLETYGDQLGIDYSMLDEDDFDESGMLRDEPLSLYESYSFYTDDGGQVVLDYDWIHDMVLTSDYEVNIDTEQSEKLVEILNNYPSDVDSIFDQLENAGVLVKKANFEDIYSDELTDIVELAMLTDPEADKDREYVESLWNEPWEDIKAKINAGPEQSWWMRGVREHMRRQSKKKAMIEPEDRFTITVDYFGDPDDVFALPFHAGELYDTVETDFGSIIMGGASGWELVDVLNELAANEYVGESITVTNQETGEIYEDWSEVRRLIREPLAASRKGKSMIVIGQEPEEPDTEVIFTFKGLSMGETVKLDDAVTVTKHLLYESIDDNEIAVRVPSDDIDNFKERLVMMGIPETSYSISAPRIPEPEPEPEIEIDTTPDIMEAQPEVEVGVEEEVEVGVEEDIEVGPEPKMPGPGPASTRLSFGKKALGIETKIPEGVPGYENVIEDIRAKLNEKFFALPERGRMDMFESRLAIFMEEVAEELGLRVIEEPADNFVFMHPTLASKKTSAMAGASEIADMFHIDQIKNIIAENMPDYEEYDYEDQGLFVDTLGSSAAGIYQAQEIVSDFGIDDYYDLSEYQYEGAVGKALDIEVWTDILEPLFSDVADALNAKLDMPGYLYFGHNQADGAFDMFYVPENGRFGRKAQFDDVDLDVRNILNIGTIAEKLDDRHIVFVNPDEYNGHDEFYYVNIGGATNVGAIHPGVFVFANNFSDAVDIAIGWYADNYASVILTEDEIEELVQDGLEEVIIWGDGGDAINGEELNGKDFPISKEQSNALYEAMDRNASRKAKEPKYLQDIPNPRGIKVKECTTCKGTGDVPTATEGIYKECPDCGGMGRIRMMGRKALTLSEVMNEAEATGKTPLEVCESVPGWGSKRRRAKIVEEGGKYYVKSEKGKNLGGPYDTKGEAEKRLRQVEYFKHQGDCGPGHNPKRKRKKKKVKQYSANRRTASQVAKEAYYGDSDDYDESLERVYTQYIKQKNTYVPSGEVILKDKLASNSPYEIKMTPAGPVFEKVQPLRDELLTFEESPMNAVVAEVDKFWNSKEAYDKLGITHNRGILLYGPPGTGKSVCLQQVGDLMAKRGDIVFYARSIHSMQSGLKAFRHVEPDRKVVLAFEEADELCKYEESDMLRILDGDSKINNVLFLATTNYIEKLPPRMLRPGRFDNKVYVGFPTFENRYQYLAHKLAPMEESDERIRELATKSEGLGFGHLKELITGLYAIGDDDDTVFAKLNFKASRQASGKEDIVIGMETEAGRMKELVITINQLLEKGLTEAEIAKELNIDVETVMEAMTYGEYAEHRGGIVIGRLAEEEIPESPQREAPTTKEELEKAIIKGEAIRIEGDPGSEFYGQVGLVEVVRTDGWAGINLRNDTYVERLIEDCTPIPMEEYFAGDIDGKGGLGAITENEEDMKGVLSE